MDRDMRLRKVCPQCNTVVHVKRSCCGCGHVFTLKRKVQVSADKSMGKAVKRRRALETVEDTLRRLFLIFFIGGKAVSIDSIGICCLYSD